MAKTVPTTIRANRIHRSGRRSGDNRPGAFELRALSACVNHPCLPWPVTFARGARTTFGSNFSKVFRRTASEMSAAVGGNLSARWLTRSMTLRGSCFMTALLLRGKRRISRGMPVPASTADAFAAIGKSEPTGKENHQRHPQTVAASQNPHNKKTCCIPRNE